MAPLSSEIIYHETEEVPISKAEAELIKERRKSLKKGRSRSKGSRVSRKVHSARSLGYADPLANHGYHEYEGKIYEPVNDFPLDLHSSYKNHSHTHHKSGTHLGHHDYNHHGIHHHHGKTNRGLD